MSRCSAYLVSAMMILGMIGGVGMHSSAAEDVQAVRQQFSTTEEISSIQIKENGASVTIRPGEGNQTYVNYADTSEEELYDIHVDNGTLVIDKLRENPLKTIVVNGKIVEISIDESYCLEIIVPQKQYDSIAIENSGNGNATLDSISSANIGVELKNGSSEFLQTQSDDMNVKIVNGSITFDRTNSSKYDCEVTNGKIQGNIIGNYDNYSIDAYVRNGTCNLNPNLVSTTNCLLKLYVKNGKIEVSFNSSKI